MAKRRALVVVRCDPPAEEAAWNRWYDTKHLPDRMVIPGFLYGRRFAAVDARPKYLTLYDLADCNVMESASYLKLRDWERQQPADSFWIRTSKLPNFARGIYEQVFPESMDYEPPNSEFVFIVGHDVPAGREEEFNAWYNTEHIPAMLRVPGWLTARRFKLCGGDIAARSSAGTAESTYFSVYDLAYPGAMTSPEFSRESNSPWSAWVRSWYTKKLRGLYRRIYPKR